MTDTYLVTWKLFVEIGGNHLDAAQAALEDIADGGNLVFTVTSITTGEKYEINLNNNLITKI